MKKRFFYFNDNFIRVQNISKILLFDNLLGKTRLIHHASVSRAPLSEENAVKAYRLVNFTVLAVSVCPWIAKFREKRAKSSNTHCRPVEKHLGETKMLSYMSFR